MRDDFAVLIITHARPETQPTQKALKKVGYTGRVILILDDEDETRAEYIRRYGEENIRIFSKDAVCFDTMDNFHKQKKVSAYARNACWEIAKQEGLRYFLMLDDDYPNFQIRYPLKGKMKKRAITDFDAVIDAYIKLLEVEPVRSISFSVDGDYIGGVNKKNEQGIWQGGRNSYFCDTSKPFEFAGRIMEDLTTPVINNNLGKLFFVVGCVETVQTAKRLGGGVLVHIMKMQADIRSICTPLLQCLPV